MTEVRVRGADRKIEGGREREREEKARSKEGGGGGGGREMRRWVEGG